VIFATVHSRLATVPTAFSRFWAHLCNNVANSPHHPGQPGIGHGNGGLLPGLGELALKFRDAVLGGHGCGLLLLGLLLLGCYDGRMRPICMLPLGGDDAPGQGYGDRQHTEGPPSQGRTAAGAAGVLVQQAAAVLYTSCHLTGRGRQEPSGVDRVAGRFAYLSWCRVRV